MSSHALDGTTHGLYSTWGMKGKRKEWKKSRGLYRDTANAYRGPTLRSRSGRGTLRRPERTSLSRLIRLTARVDAGESWEETERTRNRGCFEQRDGTSGAYDNPLETVVRIFVSERRRRRRPRQTCLRTNSSRTWRGLRRGGPFMETSIPKNVKNSVSHTSSDTVVRKARRERSCLDVSGSDGWYIYIYIRDDIDVGTSVFSRPVFNSLSIPPFVKGGMLRGKLG